MSWAGLRGGGGDSWSSIPYPTEVFDFFFFFKGEGKTLPDFFLIRTENFQTTP